MIKQFLVGNKLVQLVERVDQKRQIDEPEPRTQIGRSNRADTHTLDGSHLKLVENFHFAAQHGEGLVVKIDLPVGSLPQFIPDSKSGVDSLDNRV